jgi:hypothetical protein
MPAQRVIYCKHVLCQFSVFRRDLDYHYSWNAVIR